MYFQVQFNVSKVELIWEPVLNQEFTGFPTKFSYSAWKRLLNNFIWIQGGSVTHRHHLKAFWWQKQWQKRNLKIQILAGNPVNSWFSASFQISSTLVHVQITIFSQILCYISSWFLICQNCRAQSFFLVDFFWCFVGFCVNSRKYLLLLLRYFEKLETLLQLWQHTSLFRNKRFMLSAHFENPMKRTIE